MSTCHDGALVSVVVPVYNVAPYVEECLRSVLGQTHRNIEVIVVDDGSTDGSGDICERVCARDARATVYHKENGGLSDARNFGLARATGEWVSFIDSDDWVSPVFIEALLGAAEGLGCRIAAVPGGHPFCDGDEVRLVMDASDLPKAAPLCTRDAQRLMLYQALATGAQWRLYSRHGALHTADPFPVGMLYEDLASTYKFIHDAGETMALVDCRDLYAYRLRSTGIIRQAYSPKKADSAIAVTRQLYADIRAWYPEFDAAVSSRCFSVNRMVFAQVPADQPAERERLWGELVKYRATVARDPHARKRERLAAAIACLGQVPFRAFCAVCRKAGLLR